MEPEEVLEILKAAHGHMLAAFDELAKTFGQAGLLNADTAFACGEALGIISKAKALVGRDIDARRNG
jgi:hypothetical protein